MSTIVIDRSELPAPLSSYFAAPRIAVSQPQAGGEVTLSPIIDPADYDNDTDYLNSIPGMVEKINAARHAPKSERKPVPREWFNV